jgi:methylmalonyl-CoA/ethylmalonyl-CoA epimerase
MSDAKLFENDICVHLCFVTNQLDKMTAWFEAQFGITPFKQTRSPEPEKAQIRYRGAETQTRCRIVFFALGNVEIELIEPDEHPSTWREYLDAHGPGCHHIAFKTRDMAARKAYAASNGYPLVQTGEFTGGRYAYFDTNEPLGLLTELLEFDAEKLSA